MLTAGCINTNRARKHKNSQNSQLGEDLNLAHSQVPLPIFSKVTDILYRINAFNQTTHPILTCVALETGGRSEKQKRQSLCEPWTGEMKGHPRLGLLLNSSQSFYLEKKQGKAKLPTPYDISEA